MTREKTRPPPSFRFASVLQIKLIITNLHDVSSWKSRPAEAMFTLVLESESGPCNPYGSFGISGELHDRPLCVNRSDGSLETFEIEQNGPF